MADKRRWHPDAARGICKRIVVEGDLVLDSPAHLGNGDGADLTDIPLLTTPEGGPLLTGASLAGALRAYLRQREHGWREDEKRNFQSVLLFGGLREDPNGEQSPLIVEDAYGKLPDADHAGVEVRHGNRLAPDSRTAEHGALFDMDVWQAGTTFPLRLELLVLDAEVKKWAIPETALKTALATALAGLHSGNGGITLGARKQRGFGRLVAGNWCVREYDLSDPCALRDWIRQGGDDIPFTAGRQNSITAALGVNELDDARAFFTLEAQFRLTSDPPTHRAGSLLVRTGGGQGDQGPDMVHLHTRAVNGGQIPTLPGTSLGGALRARSRKILNTLSSALGKPSQTAVLVDSLFGSNLADRPDPCAGRLRVEEHALERGSTDLVQSRVSLDRFTGGARNTALFNEQPVFSRAEGTTVTLKLQLEDPQDYEMGLLLLLLKDLWTLDLPLGGEISVGRGRLYGHWAKLAHHTKGAAWQGWRIDQTVDSDDRPKLQIMGHREQLEDWCKALTQYLGGSLDPQN